VQEWKTFMGNTQQSRASERKTLTLQDLMSVGAPGFETFITESLREKVKGYLKVPDDQLSIGPHTKIDAFSYGERVAIFLISGREIRITLKIHYSPSECQGLAEFKKVGMDADGHPDPEAAQSLFSELANILAGSIKRELLDLGYVVGISLPIAASAYDEILSSDQLHPGRLHLYLDVRGRSKQSDQDAVKFTVTVAVEPASGEDINRIRNFEYNPDERNQQSENEFL
jgi:hypothetical protein